MSFIDLNLQFEYRSFTNDIVNDFYIPVLKEAVHYKRAVGFFSSSALMDILPGIVGLLRNGGDIEVIACPNLSEEDVNAIKEGLQSVESVIVSRLISSIEEPIDDISQKRYDLLVNLIASGKMKIQIAVLASQNSIGIYHEKLGIIIDKHDNCIAFTGSLNESDTAFRHNYESIDVYTSWSEDKKRVLQKRKVFYDIWNGNALGIRTVEFPIAVKEKLISYRKHDTLDCDFLKDENIFQRPNILLKEASVNYDIPIEPRVPSDFKIRPYQKKAVDTWAANNFSGIFDMATGTGKTKTSLAAVVKLFNTNNRKLAVLIVCPYQHLVEQWVEDIREFGMNPIICYSASRQKNWKDRLKRNIKDYNLNLSNHFCAIFTNATFASEYVGKLICDIKKEFLVIIDEAHNFGAEHYRCVLPDNATYRLALSATIDRYEDEEGTSKLYSYFGKKCIEYTLREAIRNNMLTPYEYHPISVQFTEDERDEYISITKEIMHFCSKNDKKKKISEYAKMLLIKRARIVAAAVDKIYKLKNVMGKYNNEHNILVYCGATTIQDFEYVEGVPNDLEIRQIDLVTKILGNDLNMCVAQFTSQETNEERAVIKKKFSEGDSLQALIAIRCLDEGVNIPSIKYAFILASSTNPKEYIQRRGRVLRKSPGKEKAIIYDFVMDPVSDTESNASIVDAKLYMKSLVKKEIKRIQDFASISENPSYSDAFVKKLCEKYDVNIFEKDDEDGEY